MWQNPKILQFSPQLLHLPSSPTPTPRRTIPISPSLPEPKQHCRSSRREFAIHSNSLFLLLLGSQANAEENPHPKGGQRDDQCHDTTLTKKAFLDISVDGDPIGRIIIGLYGDSSPVGVSRFGDLLSGAAGISYRRKEFTKIMPNYVQHGGVRSYGVDAELAKKTGSDLAAERLIEEWERESRKCSSETKNMAGAVSIIVRDPSRPPPKLKLVARKGRLEIDEEEVGTVPNGTEFVIAIRDSPELDASALVVGRVVEGMEVVERIGKVKTVQENTGSPYFRVAKLIGDKRAVVAERGFNRPYLKVLVTNCGLMG